MAKKRRSKKKTIGEIIKSHKLKRLEVIPIKKEGDEIVLFREKNMPLAFVLFSELETYTQGGVILKFKGKSKDFSMVCACCSNEVYGIELPFDDPNEGSKEEKENDKFERKKAKEFKNAIQKACNENGIKTLVIRKADMWNEEYGDLAGVDLMEITETGKIKQEIALIKKYLNFEKGDLTPNFTFFG